MADCQNYNALMALPLYTPGALIADKGYDSDAIRDDLIARGITPVIAWSAKPHAADPLQQEALSPAQRHRACLRQAQDQSRHLDPL